jgi:hypothetical protein
MHEYVEVGFLAHLANGVKTLKAQGFEAVTQAKPEVRWDFFQHRDISKYWHKICILFVFLSKEATFATICSNNLMSFFQFG